MTAVKVSAVGAEGRDLILRAVLDHENNSELHSDWNGAREERLHLLGAGGRRDVEIMGRLAHQGVANAAPGKERLVAGVSQTADDVARGGLHHTQP